MYILGRSHMIKTDSYEEAVRRIMALGFDGVEINFYDREFQPRAEFFEEGFAQKMKGWLAKYGAKAWSVGAHMDYTVSEENFNTVKDTIRVAAELDAKAMIITGAWLQEGVPYQAQWDKQIAAMKELAKTAEKYGVLLAIEFEPIFVIHNTSLLHKALAEVGSPMLRMNADIGHMFLQDEDPLGMLAKCGPYIAHAHLENMQQGVHNHLVPYEGDMDLAAYARVFKQIGFDGPASLDLYQYDYESVAAKSAAFLKNIFGS